MPKPIKSANPQKQLASFLAKYDPKIASLARRALKKMRARLKGSIEMVYDNYYALVVGFVPKPYELGELAQFLRSKLAPPSSRTTLVASASRERLA